LISCRPLADLLPNPHHTISYLVNLLPQLFGLMRNWWGFFRGWAMMFNIAVGFGSFCIHLVGYPSVSVSYWSFYGCCRRSGSTWSSSLLSWILIPPWL